MKAVVVEDQPDISELLSWLLRDNDIDVVEKFDRVEDAMFWGGWGEIDIVICDWQLSDGTAHPLLDYLKEITTLKVIVNTAQMEIPEDVKDNFTMLEKPFSSLQLMKAIEA